MDKKEIVHCLDEYAAYHAKGDLPYSARTLCALNEAVTLIKREIQKDESTEMDAEDFTKIFLKNWPAVFDLVYKECNLIYKINKGIDLENIFVERGEMELEIAKAILKDYGWKEARKIGKLLVDASE